MIKGLLAVVAVILAAWTVAAEAEERVEVGRFGPVTVFRAAGAVKGHIVVFSDPRGAVAALEGAARAIAEAGYQAALVDSARYLADVDRGSGDCRRLKDDLAPLVRYLERGDARSTSGVPVLLGSGAGGAIAYAALAQANPGDVAGAIGFEFSPDVPATVPFCAPSPVQRTAEGYRYPPVALTRGWWRIATKNPDASALQPYASGDPACLFHVRDYDLASARLGILAGMSGSTAPEAPTIDDLPLVLLPTPARSPVMAIIYSGDGGWRDLDKQIGSRLQADGIPVVGFDTLRYFLNKRTPEEAAASLRLVIDHFVRAWGAPSVLLIGYSFGANVLPFAVNRLPDTERRRIRQVSLLALGRYADFEIHVSGWLGGESHADALPVAPELQKLDPGLLQCFYGVEEKDETGCALLTRSEVIETGGGHHFGGDYDAIWRRIVNGIGRRGDSSAR